MAFSAPVTEGEVGDGIATGSDLHLLEMAVADYDRLIKRHASTVKEANRLLDWHS